MSSLQISFETRVDPRRVTALRGGQEGKGAVVYWMSRDQRADDNWALLYAQDHALARRRPLIVVFALTNAFLDAPLRHYDFMLRGLEETEKRLRDKAIPFLVIEGHPGETVPRLMEDLDTALLVGDFDPLRIKRQWQADVMSRVSIPFFEVDTHNVVPCRVASQKQEFAARTIRPRIHRVLDDFFTPFPRLKKHPFPRPHKYKTDTVDWTGVRERLQVNTAVQPVTWLKPGTRGAKTTLKRFVNERLNDYPEANRRPTERGQSELSPYLHYGQIAPQRVALTVRDAGTSADARDAFLEQLIVRRELTDNYCFYCEHYDSVDGFPDWARKTIEEHRDDRRETLYDMDTLEAGETHDRLWNAAQREMVVHGKMHNYLRMYWAKKILEWTPCVEDALAITIEFNDRYELDGRDPNGYVGAAWSIGGVHDRAWTERPVFGKIRYMSYNGCRSKFSIDDYIDYVEKLT